MKVYFKQNFWSKAEDGLPGIPKSLDWKFTYNNEEYFIPMVYYFPQGITFDIICLIDNEKYKMFYDKYAPIESELTEEDILFAEQENPILELPLGSIYINGQIAKTNSCASSYISFLDNNTDEFCEIKEEYNIGDEQSFHCTRVHAEYSTQREIEQLKILTNRTEELLPIRKHFAINIDEAENQTDIVFVHPLTRLEHHIYVNKIELVDARKNFPHHDSNDPNNFVIIEYEIFPVLSNDERLLIQEIKQEDIKKHNEFSSIGIIYRGENEKGKYGQKLEYIFTRMYWKRLNNIEFSITGIYKTKFLEEEFILNM